MRPAARRASVRLAARDARRMLRQAEEALDVGDLGRAHALLEGAQGAAFDAKSLIDPFHPRDEEYAAGSNDPAALPADAMAAAPTA